MARIYILCLSTLQYILRWLKNDTAISGLNWTACISPSGFILCCGCRYFVAVTLKKLLAVRRSLFTCVSRCRGFIIRDVFYSALFISMALICILWPPHFAIYFTMTKKWYRPFRAELERLVFLHRASPYAGGCRYFVAATFKKLLCTQEFLYLRNVVQNARCAKSPTLSQTISFLIL